MRTPIVPETDAIARKESYKFIILAYLSIKKGLKHPF